MGRGTNRTDNCIIPDLQVQTVRRASLDNHISLAMASSSPTYADHFGSENIPFGIASSSKHTSPQAVTRIEDTVIFINELSEHFASAGLPEKIFVQPTLNAFAALGRTAQKDVRGTLQKLIKEGRVPEKSKENVAAVQMHLPLAVGDFTDFSCSPTHNRNAGQALLGMSRGLPPGYLHMPLGPSRPIQDDQLPEAS